MNTHTPLIIIATLAIIGLILFIRGVVSNNNTVKDMCITFLYIAMLILCSICCTLYLELNSVYDNMLEEENTSYIKTNKS